MTAKGTYIIMLSGPADVLPSLLQALAAARMSAREDLEMGTEETTWVKVEFHQGTDGPPTPEFQRACMDRLDALRGPYGYEQRGTTNVIAGAADLREVVDVRTGRVVARGFLATREDLEAFAPGWGVDARYLVLREPAGLWTVPLEGGS